VKRYLAIALGLAALAMVGAPSVASATGGFGCDWYGVSGPQLDASSTDVVHTGTLATIDCNEGWAAYAQLYVWNGQEWYYYVPSHNDLVMGGRDCGNGNVNVFHGDSFICPPGISQFQANTTYTLRGPWWGYQHGETSPIMVVDWYLSNSSTDYENLWICGSNIVYHSPPSASECTIV
jgi:hypothetical protein